MSQRHDRTDITLHKERCFLIGAILPGRFNDYEDPLGELTCLVDTAGGEVVGSITQKMDRTNPRTYLGKGKFEEAVDQVLATGVDTIVVDDNLSPTQLQTIEEACRRKVIDRNEVILDIFCSRARTAQAKLQVELAQLQYELPRLVRKWTHLERLGGGIGTRGPGESQIETDRRLIRSRIASLRRQLDKIERRKVREVGARTDVFKVGLVGYTNAGKSSLLRTLSGCDAFVEDRLFATLDTLTRKVELADGQSALLSDTVGFIRRLPHHLVASFHATLEEAIQSDLLLHVVDAADPLAKEYALAADATLKELGMGDKDRIYIFNKTDAVQDQASLEGLRYIFTPNLSVSAITGDGIEELKAELHRRVNAGKVEVTLRFPAADGKRFAVANKLGMVQDLSYEGENVKMRAIFDHAALAKIESMPGEMVVE